MTMNGDYYKRNYPEFYLLLAPMIPYLQQVEVVVGSRSSSPKPTMFVVLLSKEMAESFVAEYPDKLQVVSRGQAYGSGFPWMATLLRDALEEGRVVRTYGV